MWSSTSDKGMTHKQHKRDEVKEMWKIHFSRHSLRLDHGKGVLLSLQHCKVDTKHQTAGHRISSYGSKGVQRDRKQAAASQRLTHSSSEVSLRTDWALAASSMRIVIKQV